MTKAIAALALVALQIIATLGNYWFTFGLWPHSWMSFIAFGVAHMLITSALMAVGRE